MASTLVFERKMTFFVPTIVNIRGLKVSVEPVYVGAHDDSDGLSQAIKARLIEGNRTDEREALIQQNVLLKYANVKSSKKFEENCDLWEINDEFADKYIMTKYKKVMSWRHGGFEPDAGREVYYESADRDLDDIARRFANLICEEVAAKYACQKS